MRTLTCQSTPRSGAWRCRAGVLAFSGLGMVWALGVFLGVPVADPGAALAWRWLGLKNETALLIAVVAVSGLLAAVLGAALLTWRRRPGASHRLARHLAVIAVYGCGAAFLIFALKRQFTFAAQPVECLIPVGLIGCALAASLANRKGRSAAVHGALLVAATLALAGAVRAARLYRIEYRSSADTAAYGARMRGPAGRLLTYRLPESARAALAFFLGAMPEETDLAGVTPADAVFADAGWIVDPARWRVTTFFNGTCVLQRRPSAPEGSGTGLARSAVNGQDHRIAD